mgnify:FL=1
MTNKSNGCISPDKLESVLYIIDGYKSMVESIRDESVDEFHKETDIEKKKLFIDEISRYDKMLEYTEKAKEGMREHITGCARIYPDKYKKYYQW